jgi:acetyl esterase/lipase
MMAGQPSDERRAIAATGRELSPDMLAAVHALYAGEQARLAAGLPASVVDIAYGPHERQRLDVYRPQQSGLAPVLIWVHGGGFVRGEKGSAERWPNAHAGRFAAAAGFLGVVINYRLAPGHGWPAGGEDVLAAVDWCRAHAAEHGGDVSRIVLVGTSAGAVHVATALQLRPALDVRGAVLLSGLYGLTGYEDSRDLAYYGEDRALHSARAPLEALVATELPLLVACSEFDPPRFQAEWLGLLQRRFERHGSLPRAWYGSGHNHFSLAYHLGTADTRLADEIVAFARQCADQPEDTAA